GEIVTLSPPFARDGAFGWRVAVSAAVGLVDPSRKTVRLSEDGATLKKWVTPEQLPAVQQDGAGTFTVIGQDLVFSTPDDSNPNDNGRRYQLSLRTKRVWWLATIGGAGVLMAAAISYCARRRGRLRAIGVAAAVGALGFIGAGFATNVLL